MKSTNPYIAALPSGLLALFGLIANTLAALLGTDVLENHCRCCDSGTFSSDDFATFDSSLDHSVVYDRLFSLRALGYLLAPVSQKMLRGYADVGITAMRLHPNGPSRD